MQEITPDFWDLKEVAEERMQIDYRTFKKMIEDGEVTGDRVPHKHLGDKTVKIPIEQYLMWLKGDFTPDQCKTCHTNRKEAEPIVKPLRQVVSNK